MTRDSSARELLDVFDRLGVSAGRIDLPEVWPTVAAWWSTPVTDLASSHEEYLAFLLSLSGVLETAAGEQALALVAGDLEGAEQWLVVGDRS